MKKFSKVLLFFLTLVLVVSAVSFNGFCAVDAYNDEAGQNKVALPNNKAVKIEYSADLMVCSNMGNWQDHAENSLEAIKACKDIRFISIDVKLTKDNIPILMKDTTLDRMCVDANDKAISGNVSDKNYDEIAALYLRYGNGGNEAKASNYTVPTLEQALDILKDGTYYIIDTNLDDFGTVYNTVLNKEKLKYVKFRLEDCDSSDILSIINKNSNLKDIFIPQYDGNIIFSANSLISNAIEADLNIVQLGTKNKNGVILYNSFTKKFQDNSLMAMFSFVSDYNAGRSDDVTGWDNVISQGYSIIETDYPQLLSEYIEQRNSFQKSLKSLAVMCEDYLDADFSQETLNELNEKYKTAVECLTHPSSLTEISSAYTDLSDTFNNLQFADSDEISGKFTFSVGRIIAVVLCGGAFILSQIYLYKKRAKSK